MAQNLPAIIGEIIFSPLEEVARALLEGRARAESRKPQKLAKAEKLQKRMFISVLAGEQVEVGLAEEACCLNITWICCTRGKIKGNIYKGVIHNIDSNLQAAFVNYGVGKNGFLQIDEVHPEYWQTPQEPPQGKNFRQSRKSSSRARKSLSRLSGRQLATRALFSQPGCRLPDAFWCLPRPGADWRFTQGYGPGRAQSPAGSDERHRSRQWPWRYCAHGGEGATKTTLRTESAVSQAFVARYPQKATELSAPALIHQEPGLSERSVRDYLTEDVCEIWVDNEAEAKNVREMAALLFPQKKELVRLYTDQRQSIWDHFNLGLQIEQIYAREVYLPSGGRLVFDQTEALMAIDINSGRISGRGNFEAMAFKTNMEAAEAIARQLRLRDIGGQVVIDFIEMRDKKHVLEVEKCLRQCMKSDRARHDFARMSSFGLLELVRQRMGSRPSPFPLSPAPACGGTGVRRNMEWQALHELAELREKLPSVSGSKFVFDVPRSLGFTC